MANEQIEVADNFYKSLQSFLKIKIDYPLPVYRKYNSVEEQNDWMVASDQPQLERFLSADFIPNKNPSVIAPFGFGKVNETGMIDTTAMMNGYREYLSQEKRFSTSSFNYSKVGFQSDEIIYENHSSKYLICAEGFGLNKNPFFSNIPLNGTKGEVLIIKSPGLQLDFILKSSVFIIPLGNDDYYVGATYEHHDKTCNLTEKAREELIRKLMSTISCDFEIVEQKAGMRPTTKDRRPVVGRNAEHKNVCVLNGLGTRGIMIAPYISKELYHHLEEGKHLNPEIDMARFY